MDAQFASAISERDLIKIVGIGGCGCHAAAYMLQNGVKDVEIIVANTDAAALSRTAAHAYILIGNNGTSCGPHPKIGRKLAEETAGRIAEFIVDAKVVAIVAGMGSGTGTGCAPVFEQVSSRDRKSVV